MNLLLLIATIAGTRVALPAARIESVIELDALIPVPRAAPHVAGLAALRSRVLTVIDSRCSLDMGDTPRAGLLPAAVVELDGHHYALLVDAVEDVIHALGEPAPIRAELAPGWDRAGLGLVETDGGPLLLIDVAALIAGSAEHAAAA